ncbi:UNVERIFIED_CONTAM: hypothetical protein GTU68_020332 [Idotea baltica]|nr:hypothetical protein [Idotea baltica]
MTNRWSANWLWSKWPEKGSSVLKRCVLQMLSVRRSSTPISSILCLRSPDAVQRLNSSSRL